MSLKDIFEAIRGALYSIWTADLWIVGGVLFFGIGIIVTIFGFLNAINQHSNNYQSAKIKGKGLDYLKELFFEVIAIPIMIIIGVLAVSYFFKFLNVSLFN